MRQLIFFILGLLALGSAIAEHEVDHRYLVQGYVLDANEVAIPDLDVQVSGDGAVLARGKTDGAGFYSLHLHLHNEDNRRRLSLRAGPNLAEIRVSFDPGDLSTPRVHDASFVGGKLVEDDLGRWRIPPLFYVAAGLFALFAVLVMLERRRRQKLRKKHLKHAAQSAPAGQRKKRRKKR